MKYLKIYVSLLYSLRTQTLEDLPGEHWLAIYFDDDGKGEFFDSFGRSPGPYFANYMDKHSSTWIYNDTQLQNLVSSFLWELLCILLHISLYRI